MGAILLQGDKGSSPSTEVESVAVDLKSKSTGLSAGAFDCCPVDRA